MHAQRLLEIFVDCGFSSAEPCQPRCLHFPVARKVTTSTSFPQLNLCAWKNSSVYQSIHQITNLFANCSILHVSGTISGGRAKIYHRIKFQPFLRRQIRIEVDPPQILLSRICCQQFSFFIGVQIRVDDHDPAGHIYNGFDHIPEAR